MLDGARSTPGPSPRLPTSLKPRYYVVLRGRRGLKGYSQRYGAVRDAVCETEPDLRDDLLAALPVVDLLTEPVPDVADRLRS